MDEEIPLPLPNLDYQIMQGNSLLESFEAEPLHDLDQPIRLGVRRVLGSDQHELDLKAGRIELSEEDATTANSRRNLAELRERYFACHDPAEKEQIRRKIDIAVLHALDARLDRRREEIEHSLAIRHAEEEKKKRDNKRYQTSAGVENKLAQDQAELDSLEGKRARLHALLDDPKAERPFFLWHFWFCEIFARGGFNIMIANPPYGADISEEMEPFLRSTYSSIANSLDSFIMFMELATKYLRPGGCLSFIIPSGWVSTPSSRKLRHLFTKSYHPKVFATLPYDVFGESYVDTMIVDAIRLLPRQSWDDILQKSVSLIVFPVRYKIKQVSDFNRFEKIGDFGIWDKPAENGFLALASVEDAALVAKLRRQPKRFDDFVDVMRGIETFNPIARHRFRRPRLAFTGDIYRYEIQNGQQAYINYSRPIEAGKPWKFFSGPRLLVRQLLSRKFRLQACYVEDDFLTNQSVQSLIKKNRTGPNLKTLLAFFNSRVLSWLFCQINLVARRDDFPKTIIKQTRELPLPNLASATTTDDQVTLSALVDQILTAKRAGDETTTNTLEAEIDQIVYRLFKLTTEEIALIENSVPRT